MRWCRWKKSIADLSLIDPFRIRNIYQQRVHGDCLGAASFFRLEEASRSIRAQHASNRSCDVQLLAVSWCYELSMIQACWFLMTEGGSLLDRFFQFKTIRLQWRGILESSNVRKKTPSACKIFGEWWEEVVFTIKSLLKYVNIRAFVFSSITFSTLRM